MVMQKDRALYPAYKITTFTLGAIRVPVIFPPFSDYFARVAEQCFTNVRVMRSDDFPKNFPLSIRN